MLPDSLLHLARSTLGEHIHIRYVFSLPIICVHSESPRRASLLHLPKKARACDSLEKDERMEMGKWKEGEERVRVRERRGEKREVEWEYLRTGEGKCTGSLDLRNYGLLIGFEGDGKTHVLYFFKKEIRLY